MIKEEFMEKEKLEFFKKLLLKRVRLF